MMIYAQFIIFLFALMEDQISSSQQHDKLFRDDLIVPNLLPSPPLDISPIVYKPGLIILTGKAYFSYQIKELPDISWNNRYETWYTVIVLGAFQKIPENSTSKDPMSMSPSKVAACPPQDWWHQWVKVNVFETWLDSTGTDLKPFLESNMLQPNKTHRIVYAFAVYEQKTKIELNLDDKNNSANELLKRHFTPIANFEKNFPGSELLAGNYFHVVETVKLEGGTRDDLLDPKALKFKKPAIQSEKKPDYRYFGLK